MDEAETAVATLLRARHRHGSGEWTDDFAVQNTVKTRAAQSELTAALGRYGSGLALVALFVGGAGMLALMLLWAVSPYAGLALGLRLLRRSRVASRVFAGGALAIGVLALAAYVDAAFVHLDAQGGLVFVFAPLLQWAAVAALGVACALLRAWKPDRR